MRYYLTARKSKQYQNTTTSYIETSKIQTEWPFGSEQIKESKLPSLSQFLEKGNIDIEKLMVPERFILRLYKFRLDIVRPTDKNTSCITKVYFTMNTWFVYRILIHFKTRLMDHIIFKQVDLLYKQRILRYYIYIYILYIWVNTKIVTKCHIIQQCTNYNWDDTPSLLSFGLRFLSPIEISRLHAFPGPKYQFNSSNEFFDPPTCLPHLEFPDDISQIQQYRLLGNSLNCWVVAELYRCSVFIWIIFIPIHSFVWANILRLFYELVF